MMNPNASVRNRPKVFPLRLLSSLKTVPHGAVDLEEALKKAGEAMPLERAVFKETSAQRKQRLGEAFPSLKDVKIEFMVLKSSILGAGGNPYGFVRFMHKKHAGFISNCTECHHCRPADPAAKETTRCAASHQKVFNSDMPERPGLKAAYHQQCLG